MLDSKQNNVHITRSFRLFHAGGVSYMVGILDSSEQRQFKLAATLFKCNYFCIQLLLAC